MLSPDPAAAFPELFGHLIALIRGTPDREDLIRETLGLAAARVSRSAAYIEAGIENSWALDGDPLKERLQIRRVDAIRIAQGAPATELLALARALSDDRAPIPITAQVRVTLLPAPEAAAPPDRAVLPGGELARQSVPRARPGDDLATVVEGILRETEAAVSAGQWHTVLHDAQAAMRLMPGLGEDSRRMYTIVLKRLLGPPSIEALIEQAYRVPEEEARTAEVLRGGGLAAAERMIEILKHAGTVGPRGFLVDSLAGMPEALQLIVPLARSEKQFEAKLGAELLGRLGTAEAVPVLVSLAEHPDEKVRLVVIDALGRYQDKAALEPLRQALTSPSATVRGRAGHALAGRALAARSSGAIAMPLFAAFENEKDPSAWQDLLHALARIESPEATMALARAALSRRGFLSFGSTDQKRQLAIVQALKEANTPAARQALAHIAQEGTGEVAKLAGN